MVSFLIVYSSDVPASTWPCEGERTAAALSAALSPVCNGTVTIMAKSAIDYSAIVHADYLIDVQGVLSSSDRVRLAPVSIVFLDRTLAFEELDAIAYLEEPYVMRELDEQVREIWCWDVLNKEADLEPLHILFPRQQRIRRVPFVFVPHRPNIVPQEQPNASTTTWNIHIAELNRTNSSSSILPIVAIRHLVQTNTVPVGTVFPIHNMEHLKDSRFLKENIVDNVSELAAPLPMYFAPLQQASTEYSQWFQPSTYAVLFSHARFTPLHTRLLDALWVGLPVLHNSPVLASLHPALKETFYQGNTIVDSTCSICSAVQALRVRRTLWPVQAIRTAIMERFAIVHHMKEWISICSELASCSDGTRTPTQTQNVEHQNVEHELCSEQKFRIEDAACTDSLGAVFRIGFSDMWPGFHPNKNFFLDALRHFHPNRMFEGHIQPSECDLLIFGPYSEQWRTHPCKNKVFFTAENWPSPIRPEDGIAVQLTPQTVPTWMTFIDWFSGSTQLPTEGLEDNPIRLPLHFATQSHPIPFSQRKEFCAFVVSNPVCEFRNRVFQTVHAYKHVDSGGALYNNIGGQLELKYPGGGAGDISKHHFFARHRFTISFENAQAKGYVTEKLLHAKMAGCIPLYWGDATASEGFAPNSFVNVSAARSEDQVLAILQKLEANPSICEKIASTPLLGPEQVTEAHRVMQEMCARLLGCSTQPFALPAPHMCDSFQKTYIINLDTRRDRWESLLAAEPYLANQVNVERISGVNGKTLKMTQEIHRLFAENTFQWKKSVIGCNLSHISVWKRIAAATTQGWYLVLEDDVRFVSGWLEQWPAYQREIPADADLLYLGGVLPPNKPALPLASEPVTEHWHRITPNTFFSPQVPQAVFHFCAYSYALTPRGAQKLMTYMMDSDRRSFTVSDHLLGYPGVGLIKYHAAPLLTYCFQEATEAYQNAQFDQMHREDTYDSDIWNNKECFTAEEIRAVTAQEQEQKRTLIVYHPPTFRAEGLFERAWLEDMFQMTFEFHPVAEVPADCLYAWYLVQRPHIEFWNTYFASITHSFGVLHISDEFLVDDITFYSNPLCKAVVRNYAREDLPKRAKIAKKIHTIPLGYHHRPSAGTLSKSYAARELMWSFHGTDWFQRSKQLEPLKSMQPYRCHLMPEWDHPTKTSESDYLADVSNSRFCPILRGNHFETFRLYEALEAGSMPVTTITNTNYLYSVDHELDIASIYPWNKPLEVMAEQHAEIQEQRRLTLRTNWEAWKERVRAVCRAAIQSVSK